MANLWRSILFLFLFLNATQFAFAQEDFADDITGTPLADASEALGDCITLCVKYGQLRFLDNWDLNDRRARINENEDDRLEKAMQEWLDRGMDEEQARQFAQQRMQFGQGGDQNPILSSVKRVVESVARVNGSGGGSSGDSWSYRYRSSAMDAYTRKNEESLTIEFTTVSGIELNLQESSESFQIRLIDDNGIFMLRQKPNRIQLATIRDDEAQVFVAKDYPALVAKHPKVVKATLTRLLDELGIGKPISFADEGVVDVALEILAAHQNDDMTVEGLLDQLGCDSISERNLAYEELLKGHYKWHGLIDSLKANFEFDDLAKPKLQKILTASPGSQIQDYVNSLDLLNNKRTLVRLLEVVPESRSAYIVSRLKKLTGEELGHDVEGWKKLLTETPK